MSEIKFNVRRVEKEVQLNVTPFNNVNFYLSFNRAFHSEIDAEAMYRVIHDGMAARVLAIRKDAYKRGFRDGKARRKYDEPVYDCINTEVEPRP